MDEGEFDRALAEFARRERRYGLTPAQARVTGVGAAC